jgi:hypothetical protein
MNTNHVIDSWIAELRLAPRRRRRREKQRAVAEPGAKRRKAPKDTSPRIPTFAIQAAGER